MKFLLDHMVTKKVYEFLRNKGFDVKSAKEMGFERLLNGELYEQANKMGRGLITYDRDFEGEQIGNQGMMSIIQVRIHPNTDNNVIPVMEKYLNQLAEPVLKDYLITLYDDGFTFTKFI